VRRASVSEAVAPLRDAGLIDYRRATMRVVDRQGLEARACECYAIIHEEHRRLADLPDGRAADPASGAR
jgi:hypothetical protein